MAGCFSKLTPAVLPLAYFGIESSGLSLAVDLLVLFVVVLYCALIYWTYADARRRIEDPVMIACSTAAALFFPFVGVIVYMVVRPPEYLEDVRERELEMQAAEARVHELDTSLCPHCHYRIEKDFVRCPSCLRKLKERCTNCSRPLDQAWTICPYCEADVPPTAPKRQRRTRRPASPVEPEVPAIDGQAEAIELAGAVATEEEPAAPVAADPPRPRGTRSSGAPTSPRARRPRPTP